MTGYGRASGESRAGKVTVEVRSLNHRYLEIFIRAPKSTMHLDPEIRSLVKNRVSRGKIEIFVNLEGFADNVSIDLDRALRLAGALKEIAEPLGDKVRLEHILATGEIVSAMESEMTPESMDLVLNTAGEALDNMVEHRASEGRSLASDMAERIEVLSSVVDDIENLAPQVADRVGNQIVEFLKNTDLQTPVDPQRLEAEIALISQKADIAEEIIRLKTHLEAFRVAITSGGVVGRRMDFLLQEIQREINTIGSKSGLMEISRMVVEFKAGMEKVREQVQNIE